MASILGAEIVDGLVDLERGSLMLSTLVEWRPLLRLRAFGASVSRLPLRSTLVNSVSETRPTVPSDYLPRLQYRLLLPIMELF